MVDQDWKLRAAASGQIVGDFPQANILCIGDVMLDRFIEGSVKRISPESPVPVFNVQEESLFVGGAANVAKNIFSLGGRTTLVGVVGKDAAAHQLTQSLRETGAIEPMLIEVDDRPTTEKTRFVVQGHHMLRVDMEEAHPISAETADRVIAEIEAVIVLKVIES